MNLWVADAEWDESKHPRADDGKFGPGGGGDDGPSGDREGVLEPSKEDETGTLSFPAHTWLNQYQFGVPGVRSEDVRDPFPSAQTMDELSKYVGKDPKALYRAEYVGVDSSKQQIQSWARTYDHAEHIVEGNDRPMKIIQHVFQPDEIIVDTTRLPRKYKDKYDAAKQAEVIIARGGLLNTLRSVRQRRTSKSDIRIADAEWDESKHPRDEDGKFGQGGTFKPVGSKVDGLAVSDDIPNRSSIASTLTDYEVLSGVREVGFDSFESTRDLSPEQRRSVRFQSASEKQRTERLADQIRESGRIDPLIVAVDEKGPYVLEGGHRFDALRLLGKDKFPALVVIEKTTKALWIVDAEWDESKHPRSEDGKFGPGGGKTPDASDDERGGQAMYSPNTEDTLDFDQALRNLDSDNQKVAKQNAEADDREIGLTSTVENSVGDTKEWGSENSLLATYKNASFDDIKYAAARKGLAMNQKAVLPFKYDAAGPDSLYTLRVPTSNMKEIRDICDKKGVEFRTFIPEGTNATRVVIYDQGSQLIGPVKEVARNYGIGIALKRGKGEFVGGDTRESGADVYRSAIAEYERRRGNRGRDRERVAARGVRSRTDRPTSEVLSKSDVWVADAEWDESQHPRSEDGKFGPEGAGPAPAGDNGRGLRGPKFGGRELLPFGQMSKDDFPETSGPPVEHLFHTTSAANLDDISNEGLQPHGPDFRGEQDAWPNGGTDERNYFATRPGNALNFSEPDHVLLRVPAQNVKTRGLKTEFRDQDYFSSKPVPANEIEVLAADGSWQPLKRSMTKAERWIIDVEWDESQHPRADDGKFGPRGAGGRPPSTGRRAVPKGPEADALNDDVSGLTQRLRETAPGSILEAFVDSNGELYVDTIKVPKSSQGQGAGGRMMRGLTDWADERNLQMALDPRPDPGKKAALERFYHSLGFRRNGSKGVYDPASKGEWIRPAISERKEPKAKAREWVMDSFWEKARLPSGEFDESKHPRDEDGKFSSGGGGGSPENEEPSNPEDATSFGQPAETPELEPGQKPPIRPTKGPYPDHKPPDIPDLPGADGNAYIPEIDTPSQVELRGKKIDHITNLGGGITQSGRLHFEDGSSGVFKSANGDMEMLDEDTGEPVGPRKSIPLGESWRREVAAYDVAQIVGMEDIVAPTTAINITAEHAVKSKLPQGPASLQKWVDDAAPAANLNPSSRFGDESDDIQRAVAFDLIIGNTDRHAGNWMSTLSTAEEKAKITLIDHGLAFPEANMSASWNLENPSDTGNMGRDNDVLRSDLYKEGFNYHGLDAEHEEIPSWLKSKWEGKWQQIANTLKKRGIPKAAMESMRSRYESFMDAETWGDFTGDLMIWNHPLR